MAGYVTSTSEGQAERDANPTKSLRRFFTKGAVLIFGTNLNYLCMCLCVCVCLRFIVTRGCVKKHVCVCVHVRLGGHMPTS